ncbi:Sec63 Brl domain-containing protein [Morchella snyderi]|nr:Sec63 Brl domain-containing protein [Morchella snyderi]
MIHKSQQRATIASENTTEHKTPIVQGIPLVSVNSIPDRFRGVFPFALFNAVQSKCLPSVYSTSDNVVISSPTGSGKTAVMELAICALVNELNQGSYKVVYQAPTKALCAERKKDWDGKFRTLGLTCTELTGDTQQAQLRNVKEGDIIITTPEKWDSMTRRWNDHRKLLELVRLFLIDEVHILKESRGATLEVVVSRMKSIGTNVRFVALSATVPNTEDIATWLGKNSACSSSPACEMRFGEEFRPVQLQKFVYGYQSTGNDFMFDKTLDKMLPDIIKKHSSGKPIMIFCMTRAMCVSTAKMLAEKWKILQPHERYWPGPNIGFSFKDKELDTTGICGVAFHHAGLDVNDRTLVERLFLEGCLQVICCTSTLAVGVNLPAHLVIIKNTVTWAEGHTKDYADLEVMQMIGRAGRPQFDDSAVAVIMTKRENKMKYENMVSGTEPLESCLNGNLVEHMNAEVGLGTITNVESAKTWLRSTFLYVRLKRNPGHYKFDQLGGPEDADRDLEDICEKNIDLLHQAGLLSKDEARLRCSELGDAMARYYIKFVTMQTILELEKKAGLPEVLLVLSQAQEFRDIRFRSGEKGLFKELNKLIKYPLNGELINASHKAYILIQFEIGMMEFPVEANFQKFKATLMQDKSLIFQHCHRVIRCIIDCKLHFKDSVSVRSALEVSRSLRARVWENSPLQLRQIEGFGPASVKKLVNAGIRSLETLETLEAHKIETILSRNPPFGSKIIKAVRDIPKLQVFSRQVSKALNGKDSVKLKIRAEIGYLNDKVPGKYRGMVLFANFLAERSDGLLIDFRRIPIGKLEGGKDIQFMVELEHKEQTVICYLMCEDIVGTLKLHELKPNVESALYLGGGCLLLGREYTCFNRYRPGYQDYRELSNDFDMSDFDDSASQESKKDTDTSNLRTKAEIGFDGLVTSGLETEEQLPNGNYVCRHRCGDKKKCKHFCCRDGLEKPPKQLKRKKSMPDTKALQTLPVTRLMREGVQLAT